MSRNGAVTGKEPTITKSFARLTHDAIELSELQAELLKLDARNVKQHLRKSVALGAAAFVLVLGSVPIVLMTLAEALIALFGWERWSALLLATLVGLAAGGIFLRFSWLRMCQGEAGFQRSREELSRNLHWLKSALKANPQCAHDREMEN